MVPPNRSGKITHLKMRTLKILFLVDFQELILWLLFSLLLLFFTFWVDYILCVFSISLMLRDLYLLIYSSLISIQRMQITLSENITNLIFYTLLLLLYLKLSIVEDFRLLNFSWLGCCFHRCENIARKGIYELLYINISNCGAHEGPIEGSVECSDFV